MPATSDQSNNSIDNSASNSSENSANNSEFNRFANQQFDWYVPIDPARAATAKEGLKWVINSLCFTKLDFWVVALIILLAIIVGNLFSFIPFVKTICYTCASGLSFAYLASSYFTNNKTNNLNLSFTQIKNNFFQIVIFSLFNVVYEILVGLFVFVISLIISGFALFELLSEFIQMMFAVQEHLNTASAQLNQTTMLEVLPIFYQNMIDSGLLFKLLIHGIIGISLYMIFAFIQYMFNFFALPLVISSKVSTFEAFKLSFKAFNKNFISITVAGTFLLFLVLFLGVISILPFLLLVHFGVATSVIITMFSLLLLAVIHINLQFNACVDAFWYERKKEINK
jgi:hypothetical protein